MSGRRHKAERIRTTIILLMGNFQIGGTIPRPRSAITECLHSRTEGRWKTRAQVEHSLDERGGGVDRKRDDSDRYHVSNNWLVKNETSLFPPRPSRSKMTKAV